jgi:hypothetical protein
MIKITAHFCRLSLEAAIPVGLPVNTDKENSENEIFEKRINHKLLKR